MDDEAWPAISILLWYPSFPFAVHVHFECYRVAVTFLKYAGLVGDSFIGHIFIGVESAISEKHLVSRAPKL